MVLSKQFWSFPVVKLKRVFGYVQLITHEGADFPGGFFHKISDLKSCCPTIEIRYQQLQN